MCGRYTLRRVNLARSGLNALPEPTFEEFSEHGRPLFNVAPSQSVPVVRLDKEGRRTAGLLRWGFIPHWAREQPPKVRPINARAETVGASGMFREAFQRRRCLVPADGFYEWRRVDAKNKQPMFVHFPDDRLFAFAGLWERWRADPDAAPTDTFTILTTTPNELMTPIHNRMPVIIRRDDYDQWLDPGTDTGRAAELLRPYPDGELEAVPVGRTVNNPKNDTPECIERLVSNGGAE
jgi:putative SOS response-associated peptidase YedK